MRLRTIFAVAVIAAVSVLLARRSMRPSGLATSQDIPRTEPSPYVPVVEDALKQHVGQDTSMLHAFEEALEEERRQEVQLAKDVGLRI